MLNWGYNMLYHVITQATGGVESVKVTGVITLARWGGVCESVKVCQSHLITVVGQACRCVGGIANGQEESTLSTNHKIWWCFTIYLQQDFLSTQVHLNEQSSLLDFENNEMNSVFFCFHVCAHYNVGINIKPMYFQTNHKYCRWQVYISTSCQHRTQWFQDFPRHSNPPKDRQVI